MWRALGAGAYPQIDVEAWLVRGVRVLRGYRQANCPGFCPADNLSERRWRSFPFYYTVLALSEFDYPEVIAELHYARPALEKAIMGRSEKEISLRRKALAERILRKI